MMLDFLLSKATISTEEPSEDAAAAVDEAQDSTAPDDDSTPDVDGPAETPAEGSAD